VKAQAYIVSGTVIDQKSQQPLGGASVFCQNTTIGTLTNANGEFRLTVPAGGYDIVVSYSGYETQSSRINQQADNLQSLRFILKEKDKSLEEVSIVATNEVKDGLEKYGSFFKEQFIGLTQNASLCTIENPETLKFFLLKEKEPLKDHRKRRYHHQQSCTWIQRSDTNSILLRTNMALVLLNIPATLCLKK
jgi:hypothetical protein